MKHLALSVIASSVFLLAAVPGAVAAGAATDASLFGKEPGDGKAYACFTRHYGKAHLAVHPKQNTVDMTLFANTYPDSEMGRQYALSVGVHFRKSKSLFQVSGGCSLSDDGKGGLNCGIECDGGTIEVSVKNADSILVSIPYGARTWDPESEEEPPASAKFATDDKLFRLDRTSLDACLPLVDDDIKAEIAGAK